MGIEKRNTKVVVMSLITMLIMTLLAGISMANEFDYDLDHSDATLPFIVGDSAGWTSVGHVDYKQWATEHEGIRVGDVLIFFYDNPLLDNVMQVGTRQDFESCNASFPIASYDSGEDWIKLDRTGDLYFISGIPGHCQAGQKLHVSVIPRSKASTNSPTATTASPPSSSPQINSVGLGVPPPGSSPVSSPISSSASLPTLSSLGRLAFFLFACFLLA